jgi:hypothetical protein
MERYKGGTGLSKVMMRRERLDDRRATQQKQPDCYGGERRPPIVVSNVVL